MMEKRRVALAWLIVVVDALVCGVWAYVWAVEPMQISVGLGSGGRAGGSSGLLDLTFTVVPPIATIVLARASGSTRLARYWRNAHLAVTLALIIVPMTAGLRVLIFSIAVFIPVQTFFVVGALAIWIAAPPRPPAPATESPA